MTRHPSRVPRRKDPDDPVVCRCEEVTVSQVVRAIREGHDTLEELKRHLRAGMGPCQGRTCLPLLARILARETGRPLPEVMEEVSIRPPLVPTPLELWRGG
ncbi:MAG: (2Fe-2S)-binding protein [Caldiserica bacterium]|nr:(2Fe-2S)-binding protein [Caldisericota bacterium]